MKNEKTRISTFEAVVVISVYKNKIVNGWTERRTQDEQKVLYQNRSSIFFVAYKDQYDQFLFLNNIFHLSHSQQQKPAVVSLSVCHLKLKSTGTIKVTKIVHKQ